MLDCARLFDCAIVPNKVVTLSPVAETFQGFALFSSHLLKTVLSLV